MRLGATGVDIRLDSELLVRQIQGTYRSNKLLGEFEVYTVEHVPRAQNKHADAFSKRAIEKR